MDAQTRRSPQQAHGDQAQQIQNRLRSKLLESTTLDEALDDIAGDVIRLTGCAMFSAGWLSKADGCVFPEDSLTAAGQAGCRRLMESVPHNILWPVRQNQLDDLGLWRHNSAQSGAFYQFPSLAYPDSQIFMLVLNVEEEPHALSGASMGGRLFWTEFVGDLARLDAQQAKGTPFFGSSHQGSDLRRRARLLAQNTDIEAILLEGESGTGKTTLAQWLHEQFRPARRVFMPYKCRTAGDPDNFYRDMVGVKGGAFTQVSGRPGLLEITAGGTLFLDNIHVLDKASQSSLLGFLEPGAFYSPSGSDAQRRIRSRFIFGVAGDLNLLEKQELVLPDFVSRLGNFRLGLPPVRVYSKADLSELLDRLWRIAWRRQAHEPPPFPELLLSALDGLRVKGNLRQVDGAVRNLVMELTSGDVILSEVAPEFIAALFRTFLQVRELGSEVLLDIPGIPTTSVITLDDLERRYARWAFAFFRGHRERTANALGISLPTLRGLLKGGIE